MSSDFTTLILNEAVRFGNRELRDLMRHIGQFRFGLEFEFNIEDKYAADALATAGGEDLSSSISHDIKFQSGRVYQNALVTHNKLISKRNILSDIASAINDYQNGVMDEREIEYLQYDLINEEFFRNIFPDILEMAVHYDNLEKIVAKYAMDFGRLGIDSEEFSRVFGGLFYVGLGMDIIMDISRNKDNILLGNNLDNNIGNIKDIIKLFLKIDFEPWNAVEEELSTFFTGAIKVTSSKIEFVRDILPNFVSMRFIEQVKPDITVPKGVEVVTHPLVFDDVADVMNGMADLIEEYGYTDGSTGLHVNISFPGFDTQLNPIKMMVLMDADFFQNLSPQFKRKTKVDKFPLRGDSVIPVTAFLRKPVRNHFVIDVLAAEYIKTGHRGLIGAFEKMMMNDSQKWRSINFEHMFDADVNSRRVEFRFFGGENYEFRTDEMINDVMYISYIMMMTDDDFQREEYIRGILKMLDRAATEVYGSKGVNSFLDLIDSIKSRNDLR